MLYFSAVYSDIAQSSPELPLLGSKAGGLSPLLCVPP